MNARVERLNNRTQIKRKTTLNHPEIKTRSNNRLQHTPAKVVRYYFRSNTLYGTVYHPRPKKNAQSRCNSAADTVSMLRKRKIIQYGSWDNFSYFLFLIFVTRTILKQTAFIWTRENSLRINFTRKFVNIVIVRWTQTTIVLASKTFRC